jgi:hypothetical protein
VDWLTVADALGQEGWELVQETIPNSGLEFALGRENVSYPLTRRWVFKRPVEEA